MKKIQSKLYGTLLTLLLSTNLLGDCSYELFNISSSKGTKIIDFIEQLSDECEFTIIITDPYAEEFLNNTEKYVSQQLDQHESFRFMIINNLKKVQGEMQKLFETEKNYETALNSYSNFQIKTAVAIYKILISPKYWLKLRTLKSVYQEKIESSQQRFIGYTALKGIFEEGKNFWENCQIHYGNDLSRKTKLDLDGCFKLSKDISFTYSLLANSAEKSLSFNKKTYNLFYPKG